MGRRLCPRMRWPPGSGGGEPRGTSGQRARSDEQMGPLWGFLRRPKSVLAASLGFSLCVLAPVGNVEAGGTGSRCTKTGGPEDDILRGTRGPDVLCGRGGHDVLIGLGGRDVLRGGRGADVLRPGGGRDRVLGGPGGDTVSYADGASVVTVDLHEGFATGRGRDALLEVESAVGSFSSDILLGASGHNRMRGYRGEDVIRGRGGEDKLVGEANDDHLFGGPGDDSLNGGPGTDTCRQGAGSGSTKNCE